jgi:uncharacterized membrane protein
MTLRRLSLPLEYALIAAVILTLVTAIAVEGTPLAATLSVPRVIAATLCLVFVPGYLLTVALFPTDALLDIPQRLALAFVVSLSTPPIIIFLLDTIDVRVQLETMLATLSAFIVLLMTVSALRRLGTAPDQRFLWALPTFAAPPVAQRAERVLWIGVGVGALILIGVLAASAILPEPNTQFTEFYILSESGEAAGYPSAIAPGDAIRLQMEIANRELDARRYDLTVENGGQTIYAADGIDVEPGGNWSQQVELTPVDFSSDQSLLIFRLYLSGDPTPYRTLRFWIRIETA